jgi:hypothetical protein
MSQEESNAGEHRYRCSACGQSHDGDHECPEAPEGFYDG